MAHGGKRGGAGRKAGAATKKSRAIADTLAAKAKTIGASAAPPPPVADEDITPGEIMVDCARHFYRLARDAEAILQGLTAADFAGVELEPAEQFKVLMAEVTKAAGLRKLAHDCAKDAAPYHHARISPVEPAKGDPNFVPLHERIKEYAREDAIAASDGKVVDLGKKAVGR